jgi:hypothetical protein
MKLKLSKIKVGPRMRTGLGRLDSLAASMADLGQLQPVVVTQHGTLIAGQRRCEAARRLGWTEIEAVLVDGLDDAARKLKAERDENTERLALSPSEMVATGKALKALEQPEADKRKLAGLKKGKSRAGNFPSRGKGRVFDKIGAALGVSGKTFAKAEAVVDAAAADPSLKPLVEEMDTTGKVDKSYQDLNNIYLTPKKACDVQASLNKKANGKTCRVLLVTVADVDGKVISEEKYAPPADTRWIAFSFSAAKSTNKLSLDLGEPKECHETAVDNEHDESN